MKETIIEFKQFLENGKSLTVNYLLLTKAILKLKALNHEMRLQILKLLDENSKLTVTEIFVKLRIEQSVASQQLAILRTANLVKTERNGKFIYYSINAAQIDYLDKIAIEVLK